MRLRKMSMKKVRELLRLKDECGLSLRKVSTIIELSRPVVSDYLKRCKDNNLSFERIKDMPDEEIEAILKKPVDSEADDTRYRILAGRFDQMVKELKRVGVTRRLLWEEYRGEHTDGYGYSQFCNHFQVWADGQELSMHIEHKAGDKMFVDFTGKKFSITDRLTGERTLVETFVAILGASQLTYVEAVMSQKKHDFIRASDNAIQYMGGAPAALVTDNLKSAVTKAHRYEPDINPEYIDFARHYNMTILPTRPVKPRDKALVEGAVKIVYQQIYARHRDRVWYSLDELNAVIREELERYNIRIMKGYGKSRRELFEEIEKSALRPLPAERYCLREYVRMKAQFNYHVYLKADRHYYSVPYRYRGNHVDVFFSEKTVEIYHKNERIAIHLRDRREYKYTTVPEHMPSQHRFHSEWGAERFISWAGTIGPETKTLIEHVLASRQHPEQSYRTCMGILSLSRTYGAGRLEKACRMALYYESYRFKTISNILKNNCENDIPTTDLFEAPSTGHENIRGNTYYETEVSQ
jgi:transposase